MKNTISKILGWIIAIWIISIFILGLAYLTQALINKVFAEEPIHTEEYTVSAGDTLWSIACENTDGNISEYVYNLRKLNNIDDCIIREGQVLKIIK